MPLSDVIQFFIFSPGDMHYPLPQGKRGNRIWNPVDQESFRRMLSVRWGSQGGQVGLAGFSQAFQGAWSERRTKAVGAFPDGHSAQMPVAARLRHVSATTWSTRKYMNSVYLHPVLFSLLDGCLTLPSFQKVDRMLYPWITGIITSIHNKSAIFLSTIFLKRHFWDI